MDKGNKHCTPIMFLSCPLPLLYRITAARSAKLRRTVLYCPRSLSFFFLSRALFSTETLFQSCPGVLQARPCAAFLPVLFSVFLNRFILFGADLDCQLLRSNFFTVDSSLVTLFGGDLSQDKKSV